ncbi:sugar transporter SWEET1 isoform X1 [Onychostruthus taczanowskii]|uniref:sugar transporter SWEET1 isoform X1 n=1 Tax=Onychostruthus taczanowskii TaxID=356909 RepID=UPI001B80A5A4|nr:sugar transporter SWEET1 isoform X1 [Onychostruthus taczanowskii]
MGTSLGVQWRPWGGCNEEGRGGTRVTLGVQWGMDGWCRRGGVSPVLGVQGEGSGGCSACWLQRLEPPNPSTAGHPGVLPSALPRSDLRQILATKSVENIQFLPFLTTDANNLSWLGYGCLKGDGTVITVNAIGAALQTLYILVYLYYSPAKRPVLLQVLLLLAVVVTGCGYFTILVDTGTRLTHLGLFCSVFTISMYLSPLADLAKVVRSKSTRCLSFPLTVTTLVASSSWTLYGLQLRDPYITVPNVPGIVTSLVRFWLFQRYRPEQDKPYSALPA